MTGHDIVVFGYSRGGTEALVEILGGLEPDLPVSVFVVQHRARGSERYLERILAGSSRLPICFVQNDQPVQQGCVYIAPPDQHLLVWRERLRLSRGPHENRSRPAIDPLFLSAAVTYGPRVVGVLLSGLLNDGTLGLQAVQACGGMAVIQDPDETPYSDMVLSARAAMDIDHCLPAAGIAPLLSRLAREPVGPAPPVPRELIAEVRIASQDVEEVEVAETEDLAAIPAPFSCPDCSGPLSRIPNSAVLRYRCRIGHAYTAEALEDGQAEANERALGAALRSFEERAQVLNKLATIQREKDQAVSAAGYDDRAEEARAHAEQIRHIMVEGLERD